MARGKRKTKRRIANLTNVETGEFASALRGTREYNKLKKQGYLSREQMSHRKEYKKPDYYVPDYIEEPEETYTDYPEADEQELLKERIEDMYNAITQKIDEIPNEKITYEHHQANFNDLTDSKQELLNMVDDLYAESDNDLVNQYIKTVLPKISSLVEAIYYDSDSDTIEFHISMIANLLNKGQALTFEQASTLGNASDFTGRPLGWYEKSSMLRERF